MKKIHIFDIDGTILPSLFPNIQKSDKSMDQIINDVLERSSEVDIYPEFINYYSLYCTNSTENVFLTGRQEKPFGNLTHSQLSPLKELSPFQVIFYPEENIYSLKQYFSWKLQEIQSLFLKYHALDHYEQVKFIVYDDMTAHFNNLKKLSDNLRINLTLRSIRNSNDWNSCNIHPNHEN